MGRPVPICLTLLLCDQVVWDASAGKASLLGTFNSLAAAGFPMVIPRCAFWTELTDGHGETPIVLRLVRVTPEDVDGEVVFEARFTVSFTDPRTIHGHHSSAVGLELREPGEYRLSANAFGQPLLERRLQVSRRGEQDR